MAKFRANTDDAYILTNIQNQESGDNDWAKYQVVTKDKSRLILHNNTTNSLLKVFKDTTQIHDIFGDGSAVVTYTLDGNANDLGGNYNGTWSGTEQYDTGVFGQAASFNGTNSFIQLSTYPFTNNYNKTWSFWIYVDSAYDTTDKKAYLYGTNDGGYTTTGLEIDMEGDELRIAYCNGGSGDPGTVRASYPKDEWFNAIFTLLDDGTCNIYINSSLVATGTTASGLTGNRIYPIIGGKYVNNNGTFYFKHLLDQVRIFNRALTEDEVAFLYHEGLIHIRKHDQLIIYNATDGAKIHEVTSITDNDTDKTYDIGISNLSLTETPTNAHQLTKSVDLTDKIDTSNTTATTLVLQDALENPTLVKNGETLIIDGYKLKNINVTRSLEGENVKYSVDISSLNRVPSEVVLIKPRVEISIGDENKANADDLVLDVDTNNTTTTQIVTNYMSVNDSQRTRIKNIGKIDADTGLDIQVTNVTEEGDGGSPEKFRYTIELAETQSSAPTKAIIRPTIQDILELDPNNTAYDNTNDLVNVYYQPIQKGNGFRSVQVKWNAHRLGDENNSLRVNLWKKVA